MKVLQAAILLSLLITAGCKYSNKYETVEVNKQFTLSIPDWLKEEEGLKPGAAFQYANRFRNFYAIAELQPATQTDSQLVAVISKQVVVVKKALGKPQVTDSLAVEYGGVKGVRMEIMGTMSGENIFFTEVFLVGKKRNYHISIWTRNEERKLRFKEDIQKILISFKEL